MDIFETCQKINNLINSNEEEAREELIKLLDFCESQNIPYDELVNHLIRQLGLYPYLDTETSSWQENFVYEAFKVDIGGQIKTLHREQSSVLKDLISGKNLAIIAPTSFGKSFIIDAFIALEKPKNIAIIVPTIALTDETRRRLQKKFSNQYKIITTSEVELSEKNIFIFPQERALHYVDKIAELDMLVIDEFYKASADFDNQRSTSLLNTILKLGEKSKQKYF
ncbi:MAG: DEAD/DEAH box helicase [Candidatus Thiodubiliella endoseptemdiera]|uniref:DEAD/DEAH box helicase n=1 Tax=Candidatus Thiodubiliella endoseptemdiera TaxID=2738886 RepID=A0A853F4S7_9GAMM|nr:DEAD/DEAH box helicase [Candidatus Thiodubiliella endoseptemdiera]